MMDEKEVKVWETFDRTQIEQIIQGNIRSADEKMGQMLDLFITSGYYLRRQYAEQQYKDAGYDRFDGYVKDVYGKSRAWATRMMQINEQYSICGNDPRLDPQYRGYGISQLQEMLYLSGEQREQVTPDMTVREIRALREPEPAKEESIPGQMEVKDFPEMMPGENTPEEKVLFDKKPILQNPGEEEKDILNSLAKNLIEAMRDWFLADYHGRVLDVISGEKALKEKTASNGQSRTWYFYHNGSLSHANLFDDYVQIWVDPDCIGNFEWFYLSAAIQSVWNVVALERAQNGFATSQKSLVEQYHDGEISKEELWNGQATGSAPEKNELREAGLSERTISTLSQAGITTLCELEEAFDNDELTSIRGMSNKQMDEIKVAIKQNNEADQKDAEELDAEQEEDPDEPVVDADYTEMPKEITPQSILDEAKRNLDMYIEYEAPAEMLEKQKIIVAALARMVCDLEETELKKQTEEERLEQPELPKLKNNDQRAAFVDAYETWPIWIETKETGERYYRYDLPEASMVVKVYFHRCFDHSSNAQRWEDRFHESWGGQEYYLVLDGKYFRDCKVNRSELIDYLKEVQKNK